MTTTIGVIGAGTVGSCQICLFQTPGVEVLVSDPARRDSAGLDEIARRCGVIFVCVPAPARRAGGPPATVVLDGAVARLADLCRRRLTPPIIAIRSTVTPDVLRGYRQAHPRLRLVAHPEFLRGPQVLRTALFPRLLVLGADSPEDLAEMKALYEGHSLVRPGRVVLCDLAGACLLKYALSAFLAVKTAWADQFARLLSASGSATSWDTFAGWLEADPRLGRGRLVRPGPDDEQAGDGPCVRRDVAALLHYAAARDVDLSAVRVAQQAAGRRGPPGPSPA